MINCDLINFQLDTVLKTTSKRTLANFLIYNFLRSELKKQIMEEKSNCAQVPISFLLCSSIDFFMQILLNIFPISALRIFARSHFDKRKMKMASEMAEDIRNSLIEIIQKSTWLHEKTKMNAIQKVKMMNMKIGHLKELEIPGELDLFHDSIISSRIDSSFYHLEKISEKFEIEQFMDFVASHLPILSNNDYFEAHAFYQSWKNRLVVNVPFLDDPFFDPTYPKYAKIANFGEAIAHEMGYGFDSEGRKRDETGKKNDWWTSEDSLEYEKRAQCFMNQHNGLHLDGNLTKSTKIDEMIADMIGVAVAWNAYNKIDFTNEPKIIGFEDYHMDKMFFRLTALNWCGADQGKSKVFGVNGVFSNMKTFAKAFNCPVGSPMNPEKKCELL
ncbi:hypothetical protein CAEBREN_28244 [Caenorhabditis brenneri]|uniref:Peptidase M13 C-terminal domain-containing protein n=1 Tax=Caenorhabditis brenneri TaxID=135651 RepID=G0NMV7_CAEBE|nr:hypothetical protein CAEBREN_28244 [Caenorhabditis brenneri]